MLSLKYISFLYLYAELFLLGDLNSLKMVTTIDPSLYFDFFFDPLIFYLMDQYRFFFVMRFHNTDTNIDVCFKMLKPGAIPTIFDFTDSKEKRLKRC